MSPGCGKLQQLPNEGGTDAREPDPSKPDVSGALPSDAPSGENAPGVVAPTKSNQPHSYYVRTYQHGTYFIEYEGHQLAATCRETLAWTHGMDAPGIPIELHDCRYMPSLVGQHIPSELIWRQEKELRYWSWIHLDTAQRRADILDIFAEGPINSPLRRPSPRTSPEIVKTLHWIQNTLADGGGQTLYFSNDGGVEHRVNLLPELNGCQVTFVQATWNRSPLEESFRSRSEVNLGDLDPASLTSVSQLQDSIGPVSLVTVDTTDKVPAVHLTVNARNWKPEVAPSTSLTWELGATYAARFAKALSQAITLCGGKRSSF